VERPERLGYAGGLEGGSEVLPGESGGVEWSAFVGVVEDVVGVRRVAAGLVVVGEELGGVGAELDSAPAGA
jgi:hypothetical protein